MKQKKTSVLLLLSTAIICMVLTNCGSLKVENENWEKLLDENLSKWDVFIGVPHYSVDLEGVEKGDGMKGTPLGLNKDPLNVFSAIEMEGETVLKISGEIYGGINTKKEYENYHLSMMVKWGSQKYEPRLDKPRDSGILYHCQEPQGAFWNVWMQSQEMQIQEKDCGDYYTIAGTGMDIKTSKITKGEKTYDVYNPNGEYKTFKSGAVGRCRKSADYELPNQWNRIDLVCIGDRSYHIVDGNIVMVLENSVAYDKNDVATPLAKGKIQIQSEAAEVFYKDIKIRAVNELPKAFKLSN